MAATTQIAHAVQLDAYGPPEVLEYRQVGLPPFAADEVRIRVLAAAVNYTDLQIRAGNWPVRKPSPFPYVPGVEAVGTIVDVGSAVRDLAPGQIAITMMQGLGGVRAERSGGYAEFVTVAASAAAVVPTDVNPLQMAALGLAAVTAFEGLRRIGSLEGKRILVTGAAGGVGSAAVAMAKAQGAVVIGLISHAAQADYVRSMGAVEVLISPKGQPTPLEPDSVDGILDAVAGSLFPACVDALRPYGVLSLIGAVAGGHVSFDAWQLIRPVTLTGYSTENLSGAALRAAIAVISAAMKTGAIAIPRYDCLPLAAASDVHRSMERGEAAGRMLLIP
jgi:NADPH2:quinone reductase